MVEFDWIFVKSLLRLCSYFRAFRYRIGQAAAEAAYNIPVLQHIYTARAT